MRVIWLAVAGFLWWAVSARTAPRSIADVVRTMGPAARARLRPHFERAGVSYPPARATLIVLKEEKRLELWAGGAAGGQRFVRAYDVLAASGGPGPKRRQGDLQVPEGAYRILWLNPNSSYHLSLKLDYPNAFDKTHARAEGRTNLGGDIFVHGRAVSIGCVAVGDPGIEELFVLAAEAGHQRVTTLVAPYDFRRRAPPAGVQPAWVAALYRDLERALRSFPAS